MTLSALAIAAVVAIVLAFIAVMALTATRGHQLARGPEGKGGRTDD
jgi:hypothetical protein